MLRSLEIQNFKGIRQGKLEDLAQVNILVGRNNSGKSTVLDALVLLRCALVGLDYLGVNGLDQIISRRVDRGEPKHDELWFRMSTESPIVLAVEFPGSAKVTEEWDKRLDVTVKWDSDERRLTRNYQSPRYLPNNTQQWRDLSQHIGEEDTIFLALTHMLDANSIHYPFAERLWHELVKDRKDNRVTKLLNEIYRTDIEFLSFMPFPDQTRLVAALPHAGVAVDWLGDGFRYAFNILALGVLLKGTALLVEELETHQHPESLRMLTQTLFELARQQDLQLFLTTHSEELITYALDAAKEKEITLKVHHLSLNHEGHLRAVPLDLPTAELMLDIGHDIRLHEKYLPKSW